MTVKIGIPRGLWFYDYYPLWKTFYEVLGAEVILSKPTNKEIMDLGVKNTVDEACLPVKIFHGHVADLRGKVDYIFVPKMMSVYEKEYICPKFCGLPEMIKHSLEGLPPLIDLEINFNQSRKKLQETILRFGYYVTKDNALIRHAYEEAIKAYENYKKRMGEGIFPLDGICRGKPFKNEKNNSMHGDNRKKIVVVGHNYSIYDSYSSMHLIEKLRKNGVKVIVPEMIGFSHINAYADQLEKKMFWSFGRKLLGTAMYLADKGEVDGVIYLSAFGCGIDSIIQDLFERKTRKEAKIPFMLLTVDEHTGEAGINTRIEAFMDMIDWRKRNESNLPPYGKSICSHQSAVGRSGS